MFTTLDALKEELGVADTSQDARLTRLIKGVSSLIETFCGRRLAAQDVTERLSGYGRMRLTLAVYPINSVASVTVDGVAVLASDYEILSEQGQLHRQAGWPWEPGQIPDLTGDPDVLSNRLNVVVTYNGGYKLPGDVARNLPDDLELACLRQAQYMYNRTPGIKTERTPGGYSYEVFDVKGSTILDEVAPLILPYRGWL